MKKLTKKSLDELEKEMPVISETALSYFIGGGTVYRIDLFGHIVPIGTNSDPFDTLTSFQTGGGNEIFPSGILEHMGQSGAAIAVPTADIAKRLFEYCADNSLVEFGVYINIGDGDSGNTYIVYTGNSSSGISGIMTTSSGAHIIYHSHPPGSNPNPSDEDYSGVIHYPDGTVFGVYSGGEYAYFYADGVLVTGSSSGYVPGLSSGSEEDYSTGSNPDPYPGAPTGSYPDPDPDPSGYY